MEENANENYTNMHRSFLQACANLGTMEINKAKEVFQDCWSTENDTHALEKEFLDAIKLTNKQLESIEQKISIITSDWDGREYLVFINTVEAAMSKVQIIYTEPEVHYFRLLQSEIVQSDDCSIRSITALNITNTLGVQDLKMTKTRAQELLEIWCDEGYYLDIDGMLVFGPRMQAEFGQFLKANFPDIVFACSLCKVPIFKGVSCDQPNCESLFHLHCLKKFFTKKSICPDCKKDWQVPLR